MNKYSCTHPFIYIVELYREDKTIIKLLLKDEFSYVGSFTWKFN